MILPLYESHKTVRALKIQSINGNYIIPEDTDYGPFEVSLDYMTKHNPQPGGYYVVYADGYASWSPAEAFESGYSFIGDDIG